MAEEKGILATTPQRTTAILQVHFFYVLMVLYGQSGGKKSPQSQQSIQKLYQNITKQANIKTGSEEAQKPAFFSLQPQLQFLEGNS